NTIKGGNGTNTYGIACFQCGQGTLIFQNDITGGSAMAGTNGGESSGIAVSGTSRMGLVTVDGNRVNTDQANVGSCTASASGAAIPWCNGLDSMGAVATIVNNVFFGAKSSRSAGVWLRNAEGGILNTIILNSNYLDGAGSPNAINGQSSALVLTLS